MNISIDTTRIIETARNAVDAFDAQLHPEDGPAMLDAWQPETEQLLRRMGESLRITRIALDAAHAALEYAYWQAIDAIEDINAADDMGGSSPTSAITMDRTWTVVLCDKVRERTEIVQEALAERSLGLLAD